MTSTVFVVQVRARSSKGWTDYAFVAERNPLTGKSQRSFVLEMAKDIKASQQVGDQVRVVKRKTVDTEVS